MDRSVKVAAAVVGVGLLGCVGLAIRLVKQAPSAVLRSAGVYDVVLEDPDHQFVAVGRKPDDLTALSRAMQSASSLNGKWNRNPFDTGDVQELRTSGRIFGVGNNTPATVIESTESLLFVRIKDGVNAGRTGWVRKSSSRAPGTPNFAQRELDRQIMEDARFQQQLQQERGRRGY